MNRLPALTALALTGTLLGSCTPGGNARPTVTVTASPARVLAPGTATFTATAAAPAGIARVEFLDNGTPVASDTEAPYTATRAYVAADAGSHTITARATDTQGNVGSATATVTVGTTDVSEPNDAPVTATPLTVGGGASGVIAGKASDLDVYAFTAAAGDALKVTVQTTTVNPASTLDPYVMVLLSDGRTVLERDDDGGAGVESELRFNAPSAGTYYVLVTSAGIRENAVSAYPDPAYRDDLATNTYQIALTRR